jgi:methionine-rich copper-binding protein CopC
MKKRLFLFLSITLLSGMAAHATHAMLAKSSPEDGSVSTAPSAFILEFNEAVTLHEVHIKKDSGKQVPLHNLPRTRLNTITIPAPSLTGGHYVLEWSVFTGDSHVVSGRIRFAVSEESSAAPSPTQ